MPRKTKAELRAEYEAAEELRIAEEKAQYFPRLMKALERATNQHNYELLVRDGMFDLRDRDSDRSWNDPVKLSPEYSRVDQENLDRLEWNLDDKDEERREQERRMELRRIALSKLTEEERAELGL